MRVILNILVVLLLITGAAAAQTPDGDPPSQEDVCDGLSGDAYGLCNAYCEAMDCDSSDHKASDRACERKSQKFEDLTGQPPPCGITCPCLDDDNPVFTGFANGTIDIATCMVDEDTNAGTLLVIVNEINGANADAGAFGDDDSGCGSSDPVNLMTTPDEALACADLLLAAAAADGVTCTDL